MRWAMNRGSGRDVTRCDDLGKDERLKISCSHMPYSFGIGILTCSYGRSVYFYIEQHDFPCPPFLILDISL
jgi:hypothetical protein